MSRRVVITGVGVISPVGNSQDALWDAVSQKRSGIAQLQSLPVDALPIRFGGEATEFTGKMDVYPPLPKDKKKAIQKGSRLMCREIQMGVAAAQWALQDAGWGEGGYDPQRTGVLFGSDYIMTLPEEYADGIRECTADGKFDFDKWGGMGLPKVPPLWLLKYLPNMPASHIAIYNDLRGPSNSITLREASANLSIGEAYATIARGNADTIVTGATGTRIHSLRTVHVILQEQLAQGDDGAALARPFEKNRTGMVIGEGAGAIVLEELEFARGRGADILGEVVGGGASIVQDKDGVVDLRAAIRNSLHKTLESADITAADVGHVHAHGLSSPAGDREEARAIRDVFGDIDVPVVAAKSNFGNLGAGSGAIELIASLRALREGRLFPVCNYDEPDPQCPLNIVADDLQSPGDRFINVNVTPQGQAAAIAIAAYRE